MPLEQFKQLREQLKKVDVNSLKLTDFQKVQLNGIKQYLDDMLDDTGKILAAETENEKKLDKWTSERIYQDFQNYYSTCSDFIKDYTMSQGHDPIVDDLLIPMSNLNIPVSDYMNQLYQDNQKPLSDILNSTQWMDSLFNEDPASAKQNQPQQENINAPWEFKNHSLQENIRQYKNSYYQVSSRFYDHYTRILGSDQHRKAFEYKFGMIDSMLKARGVNDELINAMSKLPGNIALSESKMMIGEDTDGKSLRIINKSRFDTDFSRGVDYSTISGLIDRFGKELGEQGQKSLKNIVKTITPGIKQLGIDNNTLNTLDEASSQLAFLSSAKDMLTTRNRKGYAIDSDNPPVSSIIDVIDKINSKTADYLKNKAESYGPSLEDYGELMDSLGEYVKGHVPFKGVKETEFFDVAYNLANELSRNVPGLEDKLNNIKSEYKMKIESAIEDQYNIVCTGSKNSGDISAAYFNIYSKCRDNEFIPDQDMEKAYHMALLRDPAFRKAQLAGMEKVINAYNKYDQKITSTKDFRGLRKDPEGLVSNDEKLKKIGKSMAICKYAEAEETRFINYQNASDIKTKIANGYNEGLKINFSKDSLSLAEAKNLEEIVNGLEQNKRLDKALNNDTDLNHSLLNPEAQERLVNSINKKTVNIFADMDNESRLALIQNNSSDSASYKAIGEKLEKINMAAKSSKGASIRDYEELYTALSTYVNSHDSKPFTTNGQKRFNSAAALMANVGNIVYMDCLPSMQQKIENDFKVTMLRSASFRTHLYANSIANMSKHKGDAEFQTEMLQNISKVNSGIFKNNTKGMITGKIKDESMYNSMLRKCNAVIAENPALVNARVQNQPELNRNQGFPGLS